jgi:formiminoglutamase
MNEIFQLAARPDESLFFHRNDPNDVRLGEIVSVREEDYAASKIVIIGCPQDEGVRRNNGREGARMAPAAIRKEFYRLTPFGIRTKIFDFGDTIIQDSLEETHDAHCRIISQLLRDGKKVISLGGGNDISYPDGCAMAEVFGKENWIAINIDAHFDVRADNQRNSGTPYRQLLEEKLLNPAYFYEIGFQPQLASPVYYRYLQNLGVNLISLDQLRSRNTADLEIREAIREKFIKHSSSLSIFFGFDIDAVRASEAPGASSPNPFGLRAGEFLTLVEYAAKLVNTKIVEFSEVNPQYDVDDRTSKLVAVAMHKFCMG